MLGNQFLQQGSVSRPQKETPPHPLSTQAFYAWPCSPSCSREAGPLPLVAPLPTQQAGDMWTQAEEAGAGALTAATASSLASLTSSNSGAAPSGREVPERLGARLPGLWKVLMQVHPPPPQPISRPPRCKMQTCASHVSRLQHPLLSLGLSLFRVRAICCHNNPLSHSRSLNTSFLSPLLLRGPCKVASVREKGWRVLVLLFSRRQVPDTVPWEGLGHRPTCSEWCCPQESRGWSPPEPQKAASFLA